MCKHCQKLNIRQLLDNLFYRNPTTTYSEDWWIPSDFMSLSQKVLKNCRMAVRVLSRYCFSAISGLYCFSDIDVIYTGRGGISLQKINVVYLFSIWISVIKNMTCCGFHIFLSSYFFHVCQWGVTFILTTAFIFVHCDETWNCAFY